MKLKHFFAAAVLGAFSGPALAVPITSTSSDFSYSFTQAVGGVNVSGSVGVDVVEYNTAMNFIRMAITLTNTTAVATAGQNRWVGWGFGISPNVTSISWSDSADGGMINASLSSLPGLAQIEVCVYGGNNCAAGNGGIAEGASDTFWLRLNFSNLTSAGVNLDPFGARFVSVGAREESFTFYTPTTPPTGVPEPGTLALLGLGLAGLGLARRRRSA